MRGRRCCRIELGEADGARALDESLALGHATSNRGQPGADRLGLEIYPHRLPMLPCGAQRASDKAVPELSNPSHLGGRLSTEYPDAPNG